jgi:hypothetical protein
MQIEPYVETIRHQLEVSAEAAGEEARAVADRLIPPLEAAIRLAIQDALAAATEEITVELAPGSVELRLRGRVPEFVVNLPPPEPADDDAAPADGLPTVWPARGDDAPEDSGDEPTMARINLRLPDRLKSRVERAAGSEGLSVNAWLVRAAAAALERQDPARRRERQAPHGRQHYKGWAR